jgi:GNAT superfamily N-acetyltransferase
MSIWKQRGFVTAPQNEYEPAIREIRTTDAEAAARLSEELGYPVTAAAMEERIQRRAALRDRVVYVACQDDAVVGWVDVGITDHIQAEPYGEIGGLVVSAACRSAGIGARLVSSAEQWIREQGLSRVIVRSRIVREAAHRFYLREGYERIKTSAVFSKVLR